MSELQRAYTATHTRDEYLKLRDRMYPGRRHRARADLEAIEAGELRISGQAGLSRDRREQRRRYPGPTEAALEAANDRMEYAAVTREDAAAKMATAEDLGRQAMAAYRAAADAWRAALVTN